MAENWQQLNKFHLILKTVLQNKNKKLLPLLLKPKYKFSKKEKIIFNIFKRAIE